MAVHWFKPPRSDATGQHGTCARTCAGLIKGYTINYIQPFLCEKHTTYTSYKLWLMLKSIVYIVAVISKLNENLPQCVWCAVYLQVIKG